MDKVYRMLEAKIFQGQGMTIGEIARRLNRTERSIWNYLHPKETPKRERHGKLDPYKAIIDDSVNTDPYINCEVLVERLRHAGYNGKMTILRNYVARKRSEVLTQAAIRFETIPGEQAQVDWKDFGKQLVDGKCQKLYAFVMVLGYSRKPFIRFTTRVDSATLLACHVLAFQFFGGVSKEILYDNMKTAFIFDPSDGWRVHSRLMQLAAHYGFIPKRCKVRRPETKGKVERMVGYLDNNFWPRMKGVELSLDDLNERVSSWVETISEKKLAEFNASRSERFSVETGHLQPLPLKDFDVRQMVAVTINRESMMTYLTNRYSVPPRYIRKTLLLLVHPFHDRAELTATDGWKREYTLMSAGSRGREMNESDYAEILECWKKGAERANIMRKPKKQSEPDYVEVAACHPSVFDIILGLDSCEVMP